MYLLKITVISGLCCVQNMLMVTFGVGLTTGEENGQNILINEYYGLQIMYTYRALIYISFSFLF